MSDEKPDVQVPPLPSQNIQLSSIKVNQRIEQILGSKDVQIITLQMTIEEMSARYNDLLNHCTMLQETLATLMKQQASTE